MVHMVNSTLLFEKQKEASNPHCYRACARKLHKGGEKFGIEYQLFAPADSQS